MSIAKFKSTAWLFTYTELFMVFSRLCFQIEPNNVPELVSHNKLISFDLFKSLRICHMKAFTLTKLVYLLCEGSHYNQVAVVVFLDLLQTINIRHKTIDTFCCKKMTLNVKESNNKVKLFQ